MTLSMWFTFSLLEEMSVWGTELMIYMESDRSLVPVITLLASYNGFFQDAVSLTL